MKYANSYRNTFECRWCNNFTLDYTHGDVATGNLSRMIKEHRRANGCGWKEPKFTGFDGIPEWTEKDTELSELRLAYAKLLEGFSIELNKMRAEITSLNSTVALRGNRIDDLEESNKTLTDRLNRFNAAADMFKRSAEDMKKWGYVTIDTQKVIDAFKAVAR